MQLKKLFLFSYVDNEGSDQCALTLMPTYFDIFVQILPV